jgi:DNA/RNA-binding domain of Phe-tRNA-synthetase-like protein
MTTGRPSQFRRVSLDSELQGRVRAGVVSAQSIHVVDADDRLEREIARLGDEVRSRFTDLSPAEISELRPARDLYRSFGIDPTKTRPSSESLLRRLLKGKEFPSVSNAVDLSNYLAVRFLLPIGLYDADKVEGDAVLRRGHAGESYAGIRKSEVHLAGRPVLVDDVGAFGNPTSDSFRTSVTDSTRSLLLVLFAPADFESQTLDDYLSQSVAAVRTYLGKPSAVEARRIDGWGQ